MEELILILEKIAKKDFIDILSIAVPIIISIVAICISINASRAQNKIALFEKRYNVIVNIKRIISFSQSIETAEDGKTILVALDVDFGTNFQKMSDSERLVPLFTTLHKIKDDVLQSKFLFDNVNFDFETFMNEFIILVISLSENKEEYDFIKKPFCDKCQQLYKTDFKKMIKTLKL